MRLLFCGGLLKAPYFEGRTGHTVSPPFERGKAPPSTSIAPDDIVFHPTGGSELLFPPLVERMNKNTELQNPEGFRCLQAPFFNTAIPVLAILPCPTYLSRPPCNARSKRAAAFGFPCFELAGPLPGSRIHHFSLPWPGPTAHPIFDPISKPKSEEQAGRGPCSCPASPPDSYPPSAINGPVVRLLNLSPSPSPTPAS